MSKRGTIPIRAPKDIVYNLRAKFPDVNDADLFRIMYNTSMVRFESYLRGKKK